MPHTHHCDYELPNGQKCGQVVAICDDARCQTEEGHANAGKHYCGPHHPDPEHYVAPTPPLKR